MIQDIRKMLKEEGAWECVNQIKIYTTEEFISEVGENNMSESLKSKLRDNISKLQKYFDERILEPL
jgi:hypothetical protein